jgi:hypothetical protein
MIQMALTLGYLQSEPQMSAELQHQCQALVAMLIALQMVACQHN